MTRSWLLVDNVIEHIKAESLNLAPAQMSDITLGYRGAYSMEQIAPARLCCVVNLSACLLGFNICEIIMYYLPGWAQARPCQQLYK